MRLWRVALEHDLAESVTEPSCCAVRPETAVGISRTASKSLERTNNALRPEMHRLSWLIICHMVGAFAISSCCLSSLPQ